MKRIAGFVVVAVIAVALGIYFYSGTSNTSAPAEAKPSLLDGPKRGPASNPPASDGIAARSLPSTPAAGQALPSIRVQTTSDVFSLFNEFRSGQFPSAKETADARYAALMALEECAKYSRAGMYKSIVDQIHSLPDSDPNKALRLKAHEFDVGRCKGFQGWTPEQLSKESRNLLAQAAQLGSSAARLRLVAERFFDEGRHKFEVREALTRELERIPPDRNALIEARTFVSHFQNTYTYVSEQSGEKYSLELMTAALYSLACEQGGLCAAKYRGTNTDNCWMSGECATLPPDEHLQREALAPAQYERFLVLRQELAANVASGRWPAGFWTGVQHPTIRLGTAVGK